MIKEINKNNIKNLLSEGIDRYLEEDEIRSLMAMEALDVLHAVEDFHISNGQKLDVRSKDHGGYLGNIFLKKISELHNGSLGLSHLRNTIDKCFTLSSKYRDPFFGWSPNVMPNGTVFVSNKEKIAALSMNDCGIINAEMSEVYNFLRFLKDEIKRYENYESLSLFSVLRNTQGGVIWSKSLPKLEKLSSNGQTLVFIDCSSLDKINFPKEFDHLVNEVKKLNMDMGFIVLRIFNHITMVPSFIEMENRFKGILANWALNIEGKSDINLSAKIYGNSFRETIKGVKNRLRKKFMPNLSKKEFNFRSCLESLIENTAQNMSNAISEYDVFFSKKPSLPPMPMGFLPRYLDLQAAHTNRMLIIESSLEVVITLDDVKNIVNKVSNIFSEEIGVTSIFCDLYLHDDIQASEDDGYIEADKERSNRLIDVVNDEEEVKRCLDSIEEFLRRKMAIEQVESEQEFLRYYQDYYFRLVLICEEPIIKNIKLINRSILDFTDTYESGISICFQEYGVVQKYAQGEFESGNIEVVLK